MLLGRYCCNPGGEENPRPHLHLIWMVELRFPVRDPAHSRLPIAKFLTEGSILWLGMTTAMGIMESNIKEKRPKGWKRGAETQLRALDNGPMVFPLHYLKQYFGCL